MRPADRAVRGDLDHPCLTGERALRLDQRKMVATGPQFRADGLADIQFKLQAVSAVGERPAEQEPRTGQRRERVLVRNREGA